MVPVRPIPALEREKKTSLLEETFPRVSQLSSNTHLHAWSHPGQIWNGCYKTSPAKC